jgi:hypothetical protein
METTTPIANPAQPAAPAPSQAEFATSALLREAKAYVADEASQNRKALTEALAEEIAIRRAQEAHAAKKAEIAARAEEAKVEASMLVEQLKQGINDAGAAATMEHAMALAVAFRMGDPLHRFRGLDGSPSPPQRASCGGLSVGQRGCRGPGCGQRRHQRLPRDRRSDPGCRRR